MDNDKTKFSTKGLTQIIALIALIGTVFLANAQSFMFIEADDEHNISSRSISANGEYIAIYMYPKGGSSYDGSEYIIKLNEPEVMYGPLEENCSMQEWSPVTDNGALFGIMYENGNTLKWFGLGEPSFSDENVPYIKLIRSFEGNENPQNCGSGNIIVGIEKDNNGNSRPVIWKPETPGEELPPLKESSAERFFGNANFVNNDGSRILGGLLGYRWIHYVVWTSDGSGYVASLLMDKYVESPWDEEDVKKPYKQFYLYSASPSCEWVTGIIYDYQNNGYLCRYNPSVGLEIDEDSATLDLSEKKRYIDDKGNVYNTKYYWKVSEMSSQKYEDVFPQLKDFGYFGVSGFSADGNIMLGSAKYTYDEPYRVFVMSDCLNASINSVTDDKNIETNVQIYTITGMPVDSAISDLPNGIYIQNNKKFVVK